MARKPAARTYVSREDISALLARQEAMAAALDRLAERLDGNGRPGLSERLTVLEENQRTLARTLAELSEVLREIPEKLAGIEKELSSRSAQVRGDLDAKLDRAETRLLQIVEAQEEKLREFASQLKETVELLNEHVNPENEAHRTLWGAFRRSPAKFVVTISLGVLAVLSLWEVLYQYGVVQSIIEKLILVKP